VEYTFEWDPEKARENLRKHGISFEHAATVMQDPLALSIYDDSHSSGEEDRWITVGRAGNDLVVMVHTFREVSADEAAVRIISARRATKNEQRQYEEG
jgi:uncharacterized DUF497 family protein